MTGELDMIAAHSESEVLSDAVRFAIETAMRRKEIAEMTWDKVDFKKRL